MYSHKFIVAAFIFALTLTGTALAQTRPVIAPRPSQKGSVSQTIGVTDVSIAYSRPGVKGRKIWGDPLPTAPTGTATLDDSRVRPADAPIVAYGHVWRTGANEATLFSISDDVLINGQKLAAGSYSLHTIPTKDEWTIIFNSDPGQWGSFSYDEKKDVLRVKAKPITATDSIEWLDFNFEDVGPTTAKVVLRWERLRVPFTVDVPSVDAALVKKVNAAMAANPADWESPRNVASFYAGNKNWTEALAWIERSIKVKETFGNLASKSNILFNSGKKEESFTVADQAIARGKADGVNTGDFEKTIATRKAAKP